MKKCPHCGKRLRDETVKCIFCGEMVEQVLQPQRGKKYWNIITILVIITICGIAFINSKNKHNEKEVSYIDANAQKENVTGQASENNNKYFGNYDNKARFNEMEQRRINMLKQNEQMINNMQQQQEQVHNKMDQRRNEMEQRHKQQLVDMEIKQYEREKQQNEINESNRKGVYQRNRLIFFESVTSK